jgi:hypothetical protein
MLKTVQLRVENPVALTGSFVRRDALRWARRCLSAVSTLFTTPPKSPSWGKQLPGERPRETAET